MEDAVDPPYEPQIRAFNVVTGLIFHSLYSNFPIRQQVWPGALDQPFKDLCETPEETRKLPSGIEQEGGKTYIRHSNVPPDMYIKEVLAWLEAEGFVRSTPTGQYSQPTYQITTRTFAILGKAPEGISERLGTTLDHAVKSAGREVGKSAISEVVGQIIGAAVKGMVT